MSWPVRWNCLGKQCIKPDVFALRKLTSISNILYPIILSRGHKMLDVALTFSLEPTILPYVSR